MAATVSQEAQPKKLHPFFSTPTAPKIEAVTPPTPDSSYSPASDESDNQSTKDHSPHGDVSKRKRKRPKKNVSNTAEIVPPVAQKKRRTRRSAGSSIKRHIGPDNVTEEEALIEQIQGDESKGESLSRDTNLSSTRLCEPVVEPDRDAIVEKQNGELSQSKCDRKSQKLLKLNPKTGTIGSPPRPKPSTPPSIAKSTRASALRSSKLKTIIVTISYGIDTASRERIGKQIQALLSGNPNIKPPISANAVFTPPRDQKSTNIKASIPATPEKHIDTSKKTPHPFFQAKGKAAPSTGDDQKVKEDKAPKRQTIYTSTPCPPKPARSTPSSLSVPISGSKSGGIKVPGAKHPAWPWRDIVHVRDSPSCSPNSKVDPDPIVIGSRRKAKGPKTQINEDESILCGTASRLALRQLVDNLKSTNDEDFRSMVPPSVRMPIKHFESGRKLQARISKELHTLKRKDGPSKAHPAIAHAYHSIATTLSAFDRSTCESVAWAQKYAPTSARCVLQNGREAMLLRDWLQSLQVQAVDTGASDNNSKPKGTSAPSKKRRHKNLDDFVVSSDSEDDDMCEISEDESQWLTTSGRGESKKTVVRSGDSVDRVGKLTNATLLSGPHGCGKTATVYAIAKELDFEVFEINAGARRSGKDILERVGDMTRNHLVHRQQKEDPQEDTATDDELASDLKSGKQGMMTSFFKPKSSVSTKPVKKVDHASETQGPASQEKKMNRDQKQSLILLEEVDILYEEDKQFWTTVISMIAQSKRPFIMTCNDESVVPLQNLKLHGIFRLSSPPIDLAVDMLLLIAANEGHALQRQAIEALYTSRGHDLRAAITELEYWCQIGVGDPRGGFDWFYPRWPKGSDIDKKGHTIRVVSEGTYRTGMGWFNRDLTATESLWPSIIPQLHEEAWDHWTLDISDHHKFENASRWGQKATEQACSRAARLDLLRSVEAFAESISDSDICGPFLSPISDHIPIDVTMPPLHSRTLGDFTICHKLLEATPLCQYSSISLGVSTSLRILARSQLLASQQLPETVYPSERFGERYVTGDIERHLKMSLQSESPVTRKDFSLAFDPIAASEKTLANGYMDPSVFDREMIPICLDVAPYVRSIVAYDQRLQNERRVRGSLLSQGGKPGKKRMRTTRASLSALEGGSRSTTRRNKYFAADINPYFVMRTGGEDWTELAREADDEYLPRES
ncbi:hypothetical protein F4861DRAFT_492723 [Xylaria intraflava]|nr:hypothetical protein F4861DRAFT_492723 [Xylaria intraflava]